MERISPIPLFWHFVWVRQPADAEFLSHESKNAGQKYTDYNQNQKLKLCVYFSRARTSQFFYTFQRQSRWLKTLSPISV